MIKSPFRSPYPLTVTQEFGNTSFNAWYLANGITAPFHQGIDICFGDSRQTYGTECVCPFDNARVVKVTWDTPTSTKGNGVTIESQIDSTHSYQVIFWHTGEIKVKVGDKLKLGDVICYIGNSGLVNPKPTSDNPWAGAHCHLGLVKYTLNGSLWVTTSYINPRELFDFTQWYTGIDTGMGHDQWVLWQWVKNLSGMDLLVYLRDKIKFW